VDRHPSGEHHRRRVRHRSRRSNCRDHRDDVCSGGRPVELVIDRPFVFSVRDPRTGAELFVGRVGDPTT
jgi:hypothetical protein